MGNAKNICVYVTTKFYRFWWRERRSLPPPIVKEYNSCSRGKCSKKTPKKKQIAVSGIDWPITTDNYFWSKVCLPKIVENDFPNTKGSPIECFKQRIRSKKALKTLDELFSVKRFKKRDARRFACWMDANNPSYQMYCHVIISYINLLLIKNCKQILEYEFFDSGVNFIGIRSSSVHTIPLSVGHNSIVINKVFKDICKILDAKNKNNLESYKDVISRCGNVVEHFLKYFLLIEFAIDKDRINRAHGINNLLELIKNKNWSKTKSNVPFNRNLRYKIIDVLGLIGSLRNKESSSHDNNEVVTKDEACFVFELTCVLINFLTRRFDTSCVACNIETQNPDQKPKQGNPIQQLLQFGVSNDA